MQRIGTVVRNSVDRKTPFTEEQLVHQADRWFNSVVAIRETIPRHIPPSDKYVKTKGDVDGTYTVWGWDRQCDLAYVRAIWASGVNKKVV